MRHAIGLILVVLVAAFIASFLRERRAGKQIPQASAPEWWSFFNDEECAEFIRLVRAYWDERGADYHITDGAIVFGGEKDVRAGLLNIAQLRHQADRSEWEQIIAEHFRLRDQSVREREEIERIIGHFDAIKDRLVLRLHPPEYAESLKDEMVYREDLPGIISTLCFDLPSAVTTVHRDEMLQWNKPVDELFDLARGNTLAMSPSEIMSLTMDDGIELVVLTGEPMYAATNVLELDRHTECVGEHGSLVAVPCAHDVLFYPINSPEFLPAFRIIAFIAEARYKEGPRSISTNVYWYFDGQFTNIPWELKDDTLNVHTPDNLAELMDRIADQAE